jgi:hypothetical protein
MSETRCSCGHAERAHVMSNPRTRQLCRECRCNQFDAERSEPAAASVPLSEGLVKDLRGVQYHLRATRQDKLAFVVADAITWINAKASVPQGGEFTNDTLVVRLLGLLEKWPLSHYNEGADVIREAVGRVSTARSVELMYQDALRGVREELAARREQAALSSAPGERTPTGKFGPEGNMQGEDHPWRK